jgi:hypothetical protein
MDNFDIENVSPTKFFNLLNLSLLPTDNWKELLEVRKKDFPQYRNNINKENLKNGNEPLSDNIIYQYWLNNEIGYANSWKSNFKEKNIALIYENNIIQIDKYISYLEQERDNLLKTISKKQKTKISYIWQSNPDKELPELYSLMIDKYKLIASETKYKHFKAVFTGQPIDEIEKIKKTKKFTNVLLTYFISKLFQESNPNDYLIIAESCFEDAKNLSQAQINYFNNQNRLPKNHSLIDALLKDLPNPL